ncbi:hypothetical protein P691DRAFT_779709 [Macrolepiota fuliginosa MF-IS2]|uniref:Uncharacterized protein n=1 Tax=Macrolepiota fuliginosa MF-IS2 TaxID=1400762 RepID=A0A9P6BXN7_9AGAR|nr:hypothetical protein P691DRAFT_779709 [Macrolepiota fuliginosa MF-IS2]
MLSTHPSVTPSFVSSVNTNAKNKPKDLYDTLAAKGWDWRSAGFCRTQSEDEIREKWEREKGELTRGWKKRWREAGRIGRRRGKGAGAGAGGEDIPLLVVRSMITRSLLSDELQLDYGRSDSHADHGSFPLATDMFGATTLLFSTPRDKHYPPAGAGSNVTAET